MKIQTETVKQLVALSENCEAAESNEPSITLMETIDSLPTDEKYEVLAMVWKVKGEYGNESFEDILEIAKGKISEENFTTYLAKIPFLHSHLSDALNL